MTRHRMLSKLAPCLAIALALSIGIAAPAAKAAPLAGARIKLVKSFSGFTKPLYVTGANDGTRRLWVVEKRGLVKVISHGRTVSRPWIDLRSKVHATSAGMNERGLLGLAFAPNYSTTGRFYVNYTDRSGNTVIARYTATPPTSNTPTIRWAGTVMKVAQPYSTHNGGCIQFGPDGYLYIGMGDGGGAGDPNGNGQNKLTRLGKILRVDTGDAPTSSPGVTSHAVPADNPFVGDPAYEPRIWALGVRNPWRFSFDRSTGDMWIGDVGQGAWEEVDFLPAGVGGQNLGWDAWEGNRAYPPSAPEPSRVGFTFPVWVYGHPDNPDPALADRFGGESVTGGYVYRGTASPTLQGLYIYGDFLSKRIWAIERTPSPSGDTYARKYLWRASHAFNISSFGQSDAGEIYVCDMWGGGVYRIVGY